jgi:cytochrome c556
MRLRAFHWLASAGAIVFLAAACSSPPPAAPPPAAQDGRYRITATMKDIMDSMTDPSADFIWESVATIVTKAGTEERRPRTDQDWKTVRQAAMRLIESMNLLVMDGRKVARPGEKSENPGIELSPEAIERVMAEDRASLITLAHGLHDAVGKALEAIDAKNADALSDAGEVIDQACEKCHLKYWYPPDAEKIEGAGSVRKK